MLLVTVCIIGSNRSEVNLSPTPTSESSTTERLPLMIFTPHRPGRVDQMLIKPGAEHYDEIRSMLPDTDPDLRNRYDISPELFDAIVDQFIELSEDDKARQGRWVKKEYHWANIDAFVAGVERISDDRVIDQDESKDICFLLPQWEAQLTNALTYIQDYRASEPEFVTQTPLLWKLEEEAIRGLKLLGEVECGPAINN